MVGVALKIKNGSKVFKPTKGDVVVFDGTDWYITTKKDLLEDAYKLLDECKEELEKLKKENIEHKKDVALQIKTMSDIIQSLYKNSEVK